MVHTKPDFWLVDKETCRVNRHPCPNVYAFPYGLEINLVYDPCFGT